MADITVNTNSLLAFFALIVFSLLLLLVIAPFTRSLWIQKVDKQADTSLEPKPLPLGPAPVPLTLRIKGLPITTTEDELKKLLKSLSTSDLTGGKIIRTSLSPSASGNQTVTATVSYSNVPKVFEPCKQSAVSLFLKCSPPEADRIPVEFEVDAHFHGLTPLSTPAKPEVDIVAVTGLAGNAFGSWKSGGAEQRMWLRDFLPRDLNEGNVQARIFTYGYDSKLVGSRSTSSVHDYSRSLLEALTNARRKPSEQRRPIIFIGHGLGGIVIKHALKEAASGGDDDLLIFKSCYALLFFGVPNSGLEIEHLRAMVVGQPNDELVRNLGTKSQLLPELQREFYRKFKFKDSRVVSFYETVETPTVKQSLTEAWERTGETILMVTKTSATHSAPGEKFHDQVGIHADHSNMVKFPSPEADDYIAVRGRILRFAKEAPSVIEKRFGGRRKRSKLPPIELECFKALNAPNMEVLVECESMTASKVPWIGSQKLRG